MTIDIDEFIRIHGGIVNGALKQVGIKKNHPDYEDFAQEVLIYLFQFLEEKNAIGNFEIDQVKSYAYTMLIWRLKKKWRQEINHKQLEQQMCSLEEPLIEMFSMAETVHMSIDLQALLQSLTEVEQQLVYELLILDLSVEQIAKKHGVHRTTIHRQRQNVQRKFCLFNKKFLIHATNNACYGAIKSERNKKEQFIF